LLDHSIPEGRLLMASSHALIDHEEIRHWAEDRHAKPACVRHTGGKGDPGMIRLDFPGYSGARSLSPISWDNWFKAFDSNNLALLVQDRTARGEPSRFNKLVSRESVTDGAAPRRRRKQASRRRTSVTRTSATGSGTRTRSARGTRSSSTRTAAAGAAKRSASTRSSANDRSASKSTSRTGRRSSGRTTATRKTGSGSRSKTRR
jgi:hypothetical protein